MQDIVNSQQWKDCLDYMSRRMKRQSYNTWLKPTKGEPTGNGEFKLAVPNQFVADWIEEHFSELVHESFVEVLGKNQDIIYVITGRNGDDPQPELRLAEPEPLTVVIRTPNHNLNERYRFDSR